MRSRGIFCQFCMNLQYICLLIKRCLYRFFDRGNKNSLTLDDFKNLLQYIRKLRKTSTEDWTIEEETDHYKGFVQYILYTFYIDNISFLNKH